MAKLLIKEVPGLADLWVGQSPPSLRKLSKTCMLLDKAYGQLANCYSCGKRVIGPFMKGPTYKIVILDL